VLVLAFAEGAGALAYRLALAPAERDAVDAALRQPVLRYRSHPYQNYVCNGDWTFPDGTRPHLAIGIRDPGFPPRGKRPGVFRIVALGESTTYGMYVEKASQAWPHLVGQALGQTLHADVEVVNAGVPNYTTWEMTGMAAFWLPEFAPDLVLVHTGLNDAFAVAYPDEGGPDGTTFRHPWSQRPIPRALAAAMGASRLVRVLGAGLLRRERYTPGDMGAAVQWAIPPETEVHANASRATGKYFRRNLEALLALIRRTGALPVLVDMPLNPRFAGGHGAYFDAVSQAVLRDNRILHEIGTAEGVPVVGLAARLRDPALFVDAAHVNQKGMAQKAQGVYEALLPLVSGVIAGRAQEQSPEPVTRSRPPTP
jgi:lysophospholipase L1-like esterase